MRAAESSNRGIRNGLYGERRMCRRIRVIIDGMVDIRNMRTLDSSETNLPVAPDPLIPAFVAPMVDWSERYTIPRTAFLTFLNGHSKWR
jgi:hypothetical protein